MLTETQTLIRGLLGIFLESFSCAWRVGFVLSADASLLLEPSDNQDSEVPLGIFSTKGGCNSQVIAAVISGDGSQGRGGGHGGIGPPFSTFDLCHMGGWSPRPGKRKAGHTAEQGLAV